MVGLGRARFGRARLGVAEHGLGLQNPSILFILMPRLPKSLDTVASVNHS